MILEFDAGNSRVKYRLRDGSAHILHRGACLNAELASLTIADVTGGHISGRVEKPEVSHFRVSSVAGSEVCESLSILAETLGVSAEFAQTSAACAGVVNSYEQPEKMGVDRWLAMIAAFKESNGPVCVVDCGTALTVDFVSSAGLHLGGLIVPGADLLSAALLRDTENVHFDQRQAGVLALGRSTSEAVNNGVLYMLIGTIHESIERYNAEYQEGRRLDIYLTGGTAPILEPLLKGSLKVRPELVLDGLQHVM